MASSPTPVSAQALSWDDEGLCVGPGADGAHGVGWPAHTPSHPTPQGGIFWFTLIDTYSTGFGLIIIALFMCLGIAFCYGERSGWPPATLLPVPGARGVLLALGCCCSGIMAWGSPWLPRCWAWAVLGLMASRGQVL